MRLRHKTCQALLASLLPILLPGNTVAQVGITFYSLEGKICVAERVYYGSVASYQKTVILPPGGMLNGSQIPNGIIRYALTIKVDEFLKGPTSDEVVLVTETRGYSKRYEQLAERNVKALFFVRDVDQAEGRKPFEDRWPDAWTYFVLTKPAAGVEPYRSLGLPIFSKDVTVLREPEDALTHAREFARRYPKNLKVHEFTIPHATVMLCSDPGAHNGLVVPIEPDLETTAKRMMTSPQEFVLENRDAIVDDLLRLEGVGTLRHFRSETNELLLKSLLDDPMKVGRYNDELQRSDVWTYPIREAAWKILKSWKIAVDKPVIEEPIPTAAKK